MVTTLPDLTGWEDTAHSLHQVVPFLGLFRMLELERVPSYLEISTVIKPQGLSTGRLPSGHEVLLNFSEARLEYHSAKGEITNFILNGQSQATLLETLVKVVIQQTPALFPDLSANTNPVDTFYAALVARNHPFLPKLEELTNSEPLEIEPKFSATYAEALYSIFSATGRFRNRLSGALTPVVVWTEHFDLSFLWFPGEVDENAPQMNFGFAPFSSDQPRPYLYAYAYPMPKEFEKLPLPAGAVWNTTPWQGLVFPYDELMKQSDPEAVVEQTFLTVFEELAPSLGNLNIQHS